MFINPKKPSCTLNLNLVSISVNIYILGVILSFINTPTHTFASIHIARHTFATLMLTAGADLYTISKLIGHADLKTTQIYSKVIDKKKQEAITLLDKLF